MSLEKLKGLGPKRLKVLKDNGIVSPGDLLYYLPRGYIDSSDPAPVATLREGASTCVELVVSKAPTRQYVRGLSIVRAQAGDASGQIRLVWFNQPWMYQQIDRGDTLLLYGRVERYGGQLTLQNPKLLSERGIIPQYAPVGNISGKVIAGYIAQLVPDIEKHIEENIPDDLLMSWGLTGIREALAEAHLARDSGALQKAKRRIAFQNLLLYQLALQGLEQDKGPGFPVPQNAKLLDQFWAQFGFRPTGAQLRVLDDIVTDMGSGRAMRRLVQGDVGSGKTAIAFAAAALVAATGKQSALMAPTEILARQHLESAVKTLEPMGIRCGLLLGGMKAAERRAALQHIASGDWQLVIGTHALLSEGVRYKDLGLVITDEQHRFGVRQRQRLTNKGEGPYTPHVLVMSATPIPRTLALILYGDLDLSVVNELPPGRIPVRTHIVPEEKRAGLYKFIRDKAAKGEQAFLVCPLVEESEAIEAKDAQAVYRQLSKGALKGLRLGLTYGSQPNDEKEAVIARFSSGEIDVLVATTVIEVGVNVPSATVMVIEDADRFGLSQLHQLRGRVGRGSKESWCFLMGEANERLKTLCQTNDGFVIAEKDLELRGPGDFLGTRQHGRLLPDAYGVGDLRLVEETRDAARQLQEDSALSAVRAALDAQAMERYGKLMREIAPH